MTMYRRAALATWLAACGGGAATSPDAALPDGTAAPDAAPAHDASPPPDAAPDAAPDAGPAPVTVLDPDPSGSGATVFTQGSADLANPFFLSLGTNGRACATCHDRAAGWTVTPAGLQARFDATGGTDPIFRLVDGATSPTADVSTVDARRVAYATLLAKGLIRVSLPVPANAEFTVVAVADPYGFATTTQLSLFRRIRPSTNLGFEATLMWDGREPTLSSQATDATLGHAEAVNASPGQMAQAVGFESALITAQAVDTDAGALDDTGVTGGPGALATQPFHVGINDPYGRDPQHGTSTQAAFTLYDNWSGLTGADPQSQRRLSIARGQQLFNTKGFPIVGMPGVPDTGQGTCSTCHDTPNTGGHSIDETISIGLDSEANHTADLPLYTLMRTSDGTMVQTSDPGRAMITGQWSDIGKFKVPNLRGLALRAPYFHNGIGRDLPNVVDFYNNLFAIGLSAQDQADLVAFLESL